MERQDPKFTWEHDRYNETRERHDGISATPLDGAVAYGLMGFAGLASCTSIAIAISFVLRLWQG